MTSPPPQRGGRWRLVPYIKANGRSPVLEWFDGLSDERLVIWHETVVPALVQYGPEIGGAYFEPLGGGLSEIWWGRCRVYCEIRDPRTFMMYLGVVKLWPKFRPRDRRLCEQYRADVKGGDYDQESRQLLYLSRRQRGSANGPA